ncbi:MAG TPA: Rieske (2Fe-2S) protein [Stellaceae bacterium]|nr:Rieske (2Fe-2S) protein [Stellaceae bacterium]
MRRGDRLCRADDVPEGGGRGFSFGTGSDLRAIFVVRKGGALFAYDNSCPHMGTPLNFLPDQFFDRERAHLLCSTHGALFRVEDGLCLDGPCLGKRLRRVDVAIEQGDVVLR